MLFRPVFKSELSVWGLYLTAIVWQYEIKRSVCLGTDMALLLRGLRYIWLISVLRSSRNHGIKKTTRTVLHKQVHKHIKHNK